jgi:hypothetical protein
MLRYADAHFSSTGYRMPVISQMSGKQTEICTRSAVDVFRFPADVLKAPALFSFFVLAHFPVVAHGVA